MPASPILPLIDLSLPLGCQQAQILGLITSGGVTPTETLRGEDLNVRFKEIPDPRRAPVAAELDSVEDRVVEHLAGVVPPEAGPRLLLFGPGSSRTDPLYALRFLAKLAMKTDRAGEMAVYDLCDNPDIRRYYAALPWGRHRAHLEFGGKGNFERLRGAGAHMILAIHPSTMPDTLFGLFADNLVRGGIGLVQASVLQEFSEGEDYELFVGMLANMFQESLEFVEPPLRLRLFRSYFSERSSDVHVLMVRRK